MENKSIIISVGLQNSKPRPPLSLSLSRFDRSMKFVYEITWIRSLLFLTCILHFLYTLNIKKLIVNHDIVTLKKHPDLPLRFRSDGTFKILQVTQFFSG